MFRISTIAHRSQAYEKAVRLREAVLRRPLGLAFTQQELDDEAASDHIVAVEGDDDAVCVGCLVLLPIDAKVVRMRQVAVRPTGNGRGSAARWSASPSSPRGTRGYREIVARRPRAGDPVLPAPRLRTNAARGSSRSRCRIF